MYIIYKLKDQVWQLNFDKILLYESAMNTFEKGEKIILSGSMNGIN